MFLTNCSSFDIFGTLLFRRISDPERRFAFLAGVDGGAQNWARRRLAVEQILSREKGPDLYSLQDIYQTLGPDGPTAQTEKEMELVQSFVATKALCLLDAARERQKPVLFVSDMYLPSEFIRLLLEKHGLWRVGDRIYVSCEQGAVKHGDLFQKICQELSLAPAELKHIGDNLRSDVLVPRRLGIRAVHFRVAEPNRYETAWASKGEEGKVVADAIRAARLQFPKELDDRGQVVWETACGVAGPLFTPYVIWLEEQARKLGLKRLYFISRDGMIFKKIYDRLFAGHASSPESRYLYGSRQAWSGVRAARLDPEDIDWLTKPGAGLTFSQFARRCGLAIERAPKLPWRRPPDQDSKLGAEHLEQLKKFLFSGPLRKAVQAAGRKNRDRAAAYLRQEGLGEGKYGLVDLGWFGNLQAYVSDLVPENQPKMGFYLDLRLRPRIQMEGKAVSFLDRQKIRGIDQASAITLLEVLAGSAEGSVEGYAEERGEWKAVQRPLTDSHGPELWAPIQHQAILAFLEEMLLQPRGLKNFKGGAKTAWGNFRQFLRHPSLLEAEVYGDIRFVSNQEGGRGFTLAGPVGLPEAWTLFLKGYWKQPISWPPGIIRRAKGMKRWLLWVRYFLTQWAGLLRFIYEELVARVKRSTLGRPPQ